MNGSYSRFRITLLQVLVAMLFLLCWHIATTTPLFAEPKKMQFFFSTPIDVLARTWRQFIGGVVGRNRNSAQHQPVRCRPHFTDRGADREKGV